jgi:hypothetical protein
MKFKDFRTEEKVRLDPKCWTGKKIGNPKTKMKGGVRVNNCVPAESVNEMDKSQTPPGRDGSNDSDAGKKEYTAKETTAKKVAKDAEKILNKELNKKQGVAEAANPAQQAAIAIAKKKEAGVDENYNPEYDDEAGMANNNLETLQRAVEGIDDLIQSGDNLPEWCQEKIAVAKSMLVAVWDYMYSEEASDEVDPEIDAMFEAMDELAEEMSIKNRVSKDLVWEQFEAMPDNMLYETAAWRRSAGKSKKGGLNAKGVASYRRENPGSKLQMAVTTKPSKLKPGSKAAKRRKSFCARMGGVKGPMKKPNGKPTRKALALRKWNC